MSQDYDCFYASVFEAENPLLKSQPLAVQQKQIIATCNYEARRRGLRKLQLIREAKKICPEVVIVLGEDLGRFRDASKMLYGFLKTLVWSSRLEKLGFDEVFLDVTEMVDYNVEFLNPHDLNHSFFYLDKKDPTVGFGFDATYFKGPTYPATNWEGKIAASAEGLMTDKLVGRLVLASHLASHLRLCVLEKHGYTASVGVSTSKLLAKMVGSVNKPNSQTTLIPPYDANSLDTEGNVRRFMDSHEVGRVPGIGFKLARKLRAYVTGRAPDFETFAPVNEDSAVTVRDVRCHPRMTPSLLNKILGGTGTPREIGTRIWSLLNGVDLTEVLEARAVPTQISIEDSYQGLSNFEAVKRALLTLSVSLIRRMRVDLTEESLEEEAPAHSLGGHTPGDAKARWLAHPRTLRLSTRPRGPLHLDGSHGYTSNRVSRSGPLPSFVFKLDENIDFLAERLLDESLVGMFRKLHPERDFSELSLINIAVTHMVESAGDRKGSGGRDIGKMFQRQGLTLRNWQVVEDLPSSQRPLSDAPHHDGGMADHITDQATRAEVGSDNWDDADDDDMDDMLSSEACAICGVHIPHFALQAHQLYHTTLG